MHHSPSCEQHPRAHALRALALTAVLASSPLAVEAAAFRVGNGGSPPCTHADLAAAVAAAAANPGNDQIYVTRADPPSLAATVDINDQDVEIIGGFADCAAATPSGRTTVTVDADPGFHIHGSVVTRNVKLRGLWIDASAGGRSLRIEDQSYVEVRDSELIGGFVSGDGGQVWMSGSNTLWLRGRSKLRGAGASGDGGGIHCSAGGVVIVDEASSVRANSATNGGGIYADNCSVTAYGYPPGDEAILDNSASADGGGIYAANGSTIQLIGQLGLPAVMLGNSARLGGALFVTDDTTLALGHNALFIDNNAVLAGGGIYLRGGATFRLDSSTSRCVLGPPCSSFINNFASAGGSGTGGAIAVTTGGHALVFETLFNENSADHTGTIAWVGIRDKG
ncbi:MAG TPA: hypothetical protein VGV61_19195 [Thermoanaerobaculia bacterium]|jgi:predicted outer membrane repeat protein|nr:hypothetical protein [Thermoanaerobaculia bacterium]